MTKQRITPGDGDPRHGTSNGYCNLRCRCAECREAWRVYYAQHRARERWIKRHASGTCKVEGCDHQQDKAYVTGYCSRHNVDYGLKPGRPSW